MFEAVDLHRPAALRSAPSDLLAIYSDGITEAENPRGPSLRRAAVSRSPHAERRNNVAAIGAAVVRAVERPYGRRHEFADDLTLLLLRRSAVPPVPPVSNDRSESGILLRYAGDLRVLVSRVRPGARRRRERGNVAQSAAALALAQSRRR